MCVWGGGGWGGVGGWGGGVKGRIFGRWPSTGTLTPACAHSCTQTGFTGSVDDEIEKILDEVDKNGESTQASTQVHAEAELCASLCCPPHSQATARLITTSLWR